MLFDHLLVYFGDVYAFRKKFISNFAGIIYLAVEVFKFNVECRLGGLDQVIAVFDSIWEGLEELFHASLVAYFRSMKKYWS